MFSINHTAVSYVTALQSLSWCQNEIGVSSEINGPCICNLHLGMRVVYY